MVAQKTKHTKTMNEITGFFTILIAVVVLCLAVCAILMPVFVFIITGHCEKMRKTLEKMEHMMRHGK